MRSHEAVNRPYNGAQNVEDECIHQIVHCILPLIGYLPVLVKTLMQQISGEKLAEDN